MQNKIIEKIQKLINKAESAKEIGNIDEAAAFSAKVNDLLMQYNLEMADISINNESEIGETSTDDGLNGLTVSSKNGKWQASLMTILCRHNYCKSIYTQITKGYRYNNRGRAVAVKDNNLKVTIIGKKENVDIVTYLYSLLSNQFESLSKSAWKDFLNEKREMIKRNSPNVNPELLKKPWLHFPIPSKASYTSSFLLGAINGVNTKLDEQFNEGLKKYGNKLNELMVVSDAGINNYLAEKYPNLSNMQSRTRRVDGSAYNKGKEAGLNASMARGVSSGQTVATKRLS